MSGKRLEGPLRPIVKTMNHNLKRLASFAAFAAIASCAFAQENEEALRINRNIRKLLVLNQLLPLLLTGSQAKALLPSIEHAHAAERRIREQELEVMKSNNHRIDAAIRAAEKGNRITTGKENERIIGMLYELGQHRASMIRTESEKVRLAMVKVLNVGQVKAASHSFDPRWLDNNLDPKTMSDEQKLRIYVRMVLLDESVTDYLISKSRDSE